VALHGIRHGAIVALVIAQVRWGHDLRLLEPSFPEEENPDDYQDLVDDFEGADVAVDDITSAEEVVNNVFLSP
jgi:H2-forming N5,N10-methylenetetrahydromethanopterin dehydrogenase-like enzyme